MVRELTPDLWPFATDEERAAGWAEPRFNRRRKSRTLQPRDHPFKDEWSFQRSMTKGNAMAGKPIAADQPCFTCGIAFADHPEAGDKAEAPPTTPDGSVQEFAARHGIPLPEGLHLDSHLNDRRKP